MTTLADLRLEATWDQGAFDKDAQGWCAHQVAVRVDGAHLHVREWGDANGAAPFDVAWQAAVTAWHPQEGVLLAALPDRQVAVDLKLSRLHTGTWLASERLPALPPDDARALAWFQQLTTELLGIEGVAEVAWVRADTDPDRPHLHLAHLTQPLPGALTLVGEQGLRLDTPGGHQRLAVVDARNVARLAAFWSPHGAGSSVEAWIEPPQLPVLRRRVAAAPG